MLDLVLFRFESELWIWSARRDDSWTFLSSPSEESDEIRALTDGRRRGFGSVRVRAMIGGSSWQTSIFPDASRGVYVLPVKRAIRESEGLEAGDIAFVQIELVEP